VSPKVHGPVIRHLQQFPMPTREQAMQSDLILDSGKFRYTPWGDPYLILEGNRRRLTFDSRSWYKTSLCTVAHTIQTLLNFPHLAMGIFFATDSKSQDVLKNGIKRHFQTNQKLRELFPEYCPQTRIMDWGTAENFVLPNRDAVLQRLGLPPRIEDSVKSLSLDKSKAGYHFDWIKCSDLVDDKNSISPSQRETIMQDFGLMPRLLVLRHDGTEGWIDVEGTFYHPDDLHNNLIKAWRETPKERRRWQIFIRGVFQRDIRESACIAAGIEPRETHHFDPDEMLLPFALDVNGKRISNWPEADPIAKLEAEEVDIAEGGTRFASQRVLDFSADRTNNRPFMQGATWKSEEDYRHVPIDYRVMTVDLADTTGPKSNPSVITVAGFNRRGQCFVESIQRGKWGPDQTIKYILDTYAATNGVRFISIEDYAFTRGLKPSLERAIFKRSLDPLFKPPTINYVKRDRSPNGKIKRIIQSLVPPFNAGELIFIEPLNAEDRTAKILGNPQSTRQALEEELRTCTAQSTGTSDDILDTLSDLFMTRTNPGLNRGALPDEATIAELRRRAEAADWERMCYGEDEVPDGSYATGW